MSFEPNLNWYSKISEKRGLPTRCPFASVYRCPRYYQSLSLMGHAGSTSIDDTTDERLKEKWKRSDLWPVTREQETFLRGSGYKQSFAKFCPEVMYDRFKLFAENLHSYADEFDKDTLLNLKEPYCADWEYNWSSLTELHYSDCSMYSLLRESKERFDDALRPDTILEVKPGVFGVSLNVKVLLTRLSVWWLSRVRKANNG